MNFKGNIYKLICSKKNKSKMAKEEVLKGNLPEGDAGDVIADIDVDEDLFKEMASNED